MDIPIIDNLKMGIVFLKPGEANYFFYIKDADGAVEFVTTKEAKRSVEEYYEPLFNRIFPVPGLVPGGGLAPFPVPVIP